MRYVIKITADGVTEAVELAGMSPSKKMLRDLVGGNIETVSAKHGILVVNTDHEISALSLNHIATDMLPAGAKDFIFGDAVLCKQDGYRLSGFFLDRAERIMRGMKESVPA